MDGLQIGDKVLVAALVEAVRTWDGWLRIRHCEVPKKLGWYVGWGYKKEGKYVSTYGETCRLTDIKQFKVMRIRFNEWGKEKYALRQDVTKQDTVSFDV